jgi:hypothetical protein
VDVLGDNEMIQHAEIDWRERLLLKLLSDVTVCLTEFGNTAGVVVTEDHPRGSMSDYGLSHVPRVYRAGIQCTEKQVLCGNQAIREVEMQDADQFATESSKMQA